MGEVFLAKQILPRGYERPIIVKRILPHLSDDEKFVEMFLQEAHTASRFQHENIAQIYQVGVDAAQYFIAMEYVQGKDVRALLQRAAEREVSVPHEVAGCIMLQVCRGLHYAHNKSAPDGTRLNLVHRDVSPQNILLSYEGNVRLIDFGITKGASAAGQTRPGTIKGKIPYMSPEQARGEALDHRSDIFSAGVVLFELLSGGPLFTGESDFAILEQVRDFSVQRLREKRPVAALHPRLQQTLESCLQTSRCDRYPSVLRVAEDLDLFLREKDFRDGSSALALLMNRLFAQEMARENEELTQTRAGLPPGADSSRAGVQVKGGLPARPGRAAPDSGDKRILKHKLVILLLALIILFEAFMFIWRDYEWRKRNRSLGLPVRVRHPPADSFP